MFFYGKKLREDKGHAKKAAFNAVLPAGVFLKPEKTTRKEQKILQIKGEKYYCKGKNNG